MIEIRNLVKYFGTKKVVDDISFSVGKGEILGFLGPNGAGKSTTMRMVTGFIPPSAGTAVIGGCDITAAPIAARKKIGYLPENAPVYPDMTVLEYLDFCADIRGIDSRTKRIRLGETIESCFLEEVVHQTVSTLSKGFKQRVCFAQSILHDPDYLILDEPTDGLDPNQKHEIRTMIRAMSDRKTIVLSTHILDEMDALCTRAIIIARGRILIDETPDQLKKRSALRGAIRLAVKAADKEPVMKVLAGIAGVRAMEPVESEAGLVAVQVLPENPENPPVDGLLAAVQSGGLSMESIAVEEGRLDDVFRSITDPGTDTATETSAPEQ